MRSRSCPEARRSQEVWAILQLGTLRGPISVGQVVFSDYLLSYKVQSLRKHDSIPLFKIVSRKCLVSRTVVVVVQDLRNGG